MPHRLAIDRFSDGLKVVFHNETPSRQIVLENCIPANINLAVVLPLTRDSQPWDLKVAILAIAPLFGFVAHPRLEAKNVVSAWRQECSAPFLGRALWLQVENIFQRISSPKASPRNWSVDSTHHRFQRGLHLTLALSSTCRKGKVLFLAGRRKPLSNRVQDLPFEINLPVR